MTEQPEKVEVSLGEAVVLLLGIAARLLVKAAIGAAIASVIILFAGDVLNIPLLSGVTFVDGYAVGLVLMAVFGVFHLLFRRD